MPFGLVEKLNSKFLLTIEISTEEDFLNSFKSWYIENFSRADFRESKMEMKSRHTRQNSAYFLKRKYTSILKTNHFGNTVDSLENKNTYPSCQDVLTGTKD